MGDPGLLGLNGMDRCEGASDEGPIEAHNDSGSSASSGPDTVRVEISEYGGSDCNGPHSLADADGDPVYVTTWLGDGDGDGVDGDAYDDDAGDGDGVYEDNERVGDCMGDGDENDTGDVAYKAGPIGVTGTGQFDGSDSEVTANGSADEDGDGVNDVDITIDDAPDSPSGHAGAICVSQADESDSAPQMPILIK